MDVSRYRRLGNRIVSRTYDYSELHAADSIDDALTWGKEHPIQFFNGNILRAKVVEAVVQHAHCSIFIETGTSHAATAIGARRFLRLPVWSCEVNKRDYQISRALTFGMSSIRLFNLDSRAFLRTIFPTLTENRETPFFYLDAHEGALDPTSLPLADEISFVVGLDSFVVLIDDFRVPDNDGFHWGKYGGIDVDLSLVAEQLQQAKINACAFPAYSPSEETGYTSGFCLFWRSAKLDQVSELDVFPSNLVRMYSIQQQKYRDR